MALSESVRESLKEAEPHIRNVLAYASRQERPQVSLQIARILYELNNVITVDESTDVIENILKKFKSGGNFE